MKKAIIKALSVMLVVVITLTSAPLSGFVGIELPKWLDFSIEASAEVFSGCDSNTSWSYDDETYILTISDSGDMENYTKDNLPPWHQYSKAIKQIVIEDGVTLIGDYAFASCTNLVSITIPRSVKVIGSYAFSGCSHLTSIKIPDSVTTINSYAFEYCTGIKDVAIPDSVISIGYNAFYGCINIKSFTVDDNNDNYSNDQYGVLFNKDKTTLVKYPTANSRTNYSIPSTVGTIKSYAFALCESLTSVSISKNVSSIGHHAFYGCNNIKSFIVDDNNGKFSSDEHGVLFNKDKTTLIQYPTGNTRTSYVVPDGVKKIGNTFIDCDTYSNIAAAAFYNCKYLTKIEIPDSVTEIDRYSFYGCKNLELIIIGNYDDYGCDNYSRLESVGYRAFYGCDSLEDVFFSGVKYDWNNVSIDDDNEQFLSARIHLKDGTEINKSKIDSSNNDIVISPYDSTVENRFAFSMVGVKCTEGSTVTENSILKRDFILSYTNSSQKVTLSQNEYQNYVIPKAVIESWKTIKIDEKNESKPSYKHTAIMQKDNKDGKPYVSTVFARKGSDGYLNVTQSDINVLKGNSYDIIISADNLGGMSCTYYIEQDANHKISSSTGVFSSVDLYNKLDFRKACYAYVKTSNGAMSELVSVKFTKQPEGVLDKTETFLKGLTLNLLGNDFLSYTLPKDVPLIGDAKISFEAFQLPAGIEIDGDSVKISIGANIFHWGTEIKANSNTKYKKWSFECFEDWKDLCKKDGFDKTEKAYDKYTKSKEKFQDTWYGKKGKPNKTKDWSVEALGYIDATIINGQVVVKEAQLSLGGRFSFKYTQQGAIWIIPTYVYAQMGSYFGGAANGSRVVADSEIPVEWEWIFNIEPELKLGAGAGVKDVASAGVWAKATAPATFNITNKHVKWDLTGKIGIEGQLFIFKGEKTLLDGTVNLVNRYWGSSPKMMTYMNQQFGVATTNVSPKTEISVIDRDYLEKTSDWLDNGMLNFYGAAENGMSIVDLQKSVFSEASPQVVSFGDKMLMTWVEDDAERDTYNRMRLMYSIYENGSWSIPVPVCDDGKNDTMPVITTDGTDVYFTWQKVEDVITEETATIDNLVAKTEIYTAKYDSSTNSIVDTKRVSNNSCYDYAQSISIVNGEPVCYWVSCADNNMNTSTNNTIYRYEFGGSTTLVKSNLNYVLSLTGTSVDGVENISYSMDADGDTTSTDDITVYTIVNDSITTFDKGDNEIAYTSVFYGEFNGKQTLFTSDMGNIYYVEDGETKSVIDGNHMISGNFNYVIKNGTPTLFWTEKEEVGNAVYSSSYENDAWTTPVKVSNTGTQLSSVDVVAYNNQFKGVCTSSTLEYSEDKEMYEYVQTNLCSFIIGEVQDISVDGIYIDEEKIKIGEETEFDVYVTNNGTETINEVSFEITDTLGYSTFVTKSVNLASGEGRFVTLSYTAPENYAKTTLSVTVTCDEIIDNVTENNTATKEIGKSSLILTESEVIEVDGQYLITSMITNESDVTAENVVVNTLFNDNEDVVESMTIESIGPRETYSIEYVLYEEDLIFDDENDAARVYIAVDESSGQYISNKICYTIAKPLELECGHILTEDIGRREPTCTEDGYEDGVRCTLCEEAISGLEIIPAIGHDYRLEIIEGTEDQVEYAQYICSLCNDESIVFFDIDNRIEGLKYKSNTVENVISRINESGKRIVVFNFENIELSNTDLVGTGAKVYIYDANTDELLNAYTVVLYGDVNGDGLINEADQEIITSVATCKSTIDNQWFLMAADTNHDGAVDGFDVIETELQTLDMYNIEQKNNNAYLPKDEEDESKPEINEEDPDGDGWWG